MNFNEEKRRPWRVGILFSQTGVTSAVEQSQLNATLLAIEEINSAGGVLDRMIEPVIYDPASDPKQFRAWPSACSRSIASGCCSAAICRAPARRSCRSSKATAACYSIRRSMRGSNIRGTASTPVLRRTRIRCSSPRFLLSTYGNRFLLVGIELHLSLRIQSADGRFRGAGPRRGPGRDLCSA